MEAKRTAGLEALGKYLKNLRTRNGWSLRQAAGQAGLSHATISRLEGGKITTLPELATLKIIASTYSIPVDLLLQFVASEEEATDPGSILPIPPSLGTMLREWRLKKGLKPEELNREIGWLKPGLLKLIEEGARQVTEEELEEITAILGLSLEEKGELRYLGGVLNHTLSQYVRQACEESLRDWQYGPAFALSMPFWEVFAANSHAAVSLFQQEAPDAKVCQFSPPLNYLDVLASPNSYLSTMLSANNCWNETVYKEVSLFKNLTRRFTYNSSYQQYIRRLLQGSSLFKEAWQRNHAEALRPASMESEIAINPPVEGYGKKRRTLRFYSFRILLSADPRVLITRFFPLDIPTWEYAMEFNNQFLNDSAKVRGL